MKTKESGILDLRYFGSIIREDFDYASDADILCIVTDKAAADLNGISKLLDSALVTDREIDLSVYGADRISEMYKEGHLFAWHIYLQSKPITGHLNFLENLGVPREYTKAKIDIENLIKIVQDSHLSLMDDSCSPVYEAGLLYVASRNIGISASWKSSNGLDFSRHAPYSLILNGQDKGLPLKKSEYAMLCESRHASTRGVYPPSITREQCIAICEIVIRWAKEVLEEIKVSL